MNIYQRINAVRKEVDYIQKNKSVSTGQSGSYKAVTHDEVTGIVRKHLVEHGIVCVPSLVESRVSPTTNKDGAVSNVIRYEATYDFRFVNIEDPQDAFTVRIEAHANDNQDKAPGKALSYAKKYAILKLLDLETGEDEESRHAEKEEFPVGDWLAKIHASTTLPELKTNFEAAYEAAKLVNDVAASKVFIKAKDAKKKTLEAANG